MIAASTVMVFMVLLGALSLMYQIFKIVVLDAESRGLKHPKFWGIFSLGGNNGSGGFLLYLIGRNKYPSAMTDEVKKNYCITQKKSRFIFVFYRCRNYWIDFCCSFWEYLS